jgi:hypothetical protein
MAKVASTMTPEYLRRLKLYELAIAMVPGLERKGAAVPYTAVNGNMSSYLHPRGDLALRLAEPQRNEFLSQHNTGLFEAYGAVHREYVTVPQTLLADTRALVAYLRASLQYVMTLKAKPSKKKEATKVARVAGVAGVAGVAEAAPRKTGKKTAKKSTAARVKPAAKRKR